VTYLPTGGLGGPDSVRLGDTTVFSLHFGGVIPSDSIRSFAIDWGERGSRTSQTVPASKSFAQLPNEVQFFFHRTFQDTGVHRIRGGITTRDGTLYQYADSFRVYGGTRLSGQTGVDSAGHLVTGGMMAQLRQALENMRRELARQGEPMDNLQRCQVSVADMNDWHRESDEVFSSYFTYGKGPGLSVQEGWNMPKGVRIVLDCTARPR
jgi:enamine deaminase RidA (YjgF/YER057c/UK114 family)